MSDYKTTVGDITSYAKIAELSSLLRLRMEIILSNQNTEILFSPAETCEVSMFTMLFSYFAVLMTGAFRNQLPMPCTKSYSKNEKKKVAALYHLVFDGYSFYLKTEF